MQATILEYFRKHSALVEENLRLCSDPLDPEAVHNLRLSIKRLRVVNRLAERIGSGTFSGQETMQEVNALFKRAGRLRDIQVLRFLCDTLTDAPDTILQKFRENLQQRESKRRSKFEPVLSAFNKAVLADYEEQLAYILKDVTQDRAYFSAEEMLIGYISDIHELFYGSDGEERLHRIRSRLKDVNYLNNIFAETLPIEDYLHIQAGRLREVGELAGSWHDHLVFEYQLKKFARNLPANEHSAAIREMTSILEVKKNSLYQEYICILQNEIRI